MSLTDRQFFLLAVLFYGLALVWSVFAQRRGKGTDGVASYGLLLCGLVLHTVTLAMRGFSLERCPVNNLFEATAFFLWTFLVAYGVMGAFPRLRFLGTYVAPLAFAVGFFAMMPSLDPPHGPKPEFTGGWISLHATLILLSYGAFGLAAAAAAMFLTQDHDLKLHKLRAILSKLPPIERIERIESRLLVAGWTLLTIGIAIIPLAVDRPEGVSLLADSKVLWSLVVWGAYSVLVVWHFRFRFVGRRFAWGVVANFVFVLLTFWGTNLLSRVHN